MSASLVLFLWVVLLLGLLCFDPAREPKASAALWVPLIWLFFIVSRTPSLWLGLSYSANLGQALEEGSPLDRTIFSLLHCAGIRDPLFTSAPVAQVRLAEFCACLIFGVCSAERCVVGFSVHNFQEVVP